MSQWKKHPVALAAGELAALALMVALPQGAAQAAGSDENTQSVVISTGSRGAARTVTNSLSPIDVIGEEELARTGKQNLREALAELAPSYTETAGFKGQVGIAVNTATLRGLAGTNVLVLVNGKRRHISALIISGLGPAGADLDLIPTAAIKRVEILRDGAAAQYGSDAIAGVINIILKDNAEGGSFSITGSRYFSTVGDQGLYGDTGNVQISQGFKLGSDGGFGNVTLQVLNQDATNVAGPVPGPGEPGARTIYFPINGEADPREFGQSRYRQIQGRPRVDLVNVAYNTELPVAGLTVYSNGTGSRRNARGWGTYRTANAQQNIESVYPDGFLPQFGVIDTDHQLVFGVKSGQGGQLAGWDWDLSTSYSHNDGNSRNRDTLNPTLGPDSPVNFDNGHLRQNEWTSNLDLTRQIDTGAFEKPLSLSAGAELRRVVFKQIAGEYASYADGDWVFPAGHPFAGIKPNPGAAGFAGYAPEVSGSYSRQVRALWLDATQALGAGWDLSAAVRHERYDDVGGTTSGKLSARWQATPALALRGTLNNGFAAPTLQQQHFTNVLSAYSTNAITGVLSQSFTRSVPAYDAAAVALGAKPLTPERSRNASLGLVWKPTRDTTVTADAYQIEIRDRIALSTTLNSVLIAPILRAAGLSPNQSVSFYLNVGDTTTRGVDIVAEHTQRLQQWGRLRWTLLVNQIETRLDRVAAQPAELAGTTIDLIGRGTIGRLTEAYPKNTTALSAAWSVGAWETTVKATRYSRVYGRNANSALRDEVVEPAVIVNASVGWQARPDLKLTVGAVNLFNKRPEQLNDEAIRYYGFPVGRPNYSWYSPYGVNGGYWFARAEYTW